MENEIKVFKNDMFGELEILISNEKKYFPATDVAKLLGYKNPRDAISKHCKKDGVISAKDKTTEGNVYLKKYINKDNLVLLISKSRLLTEKQKMDFLTSIGINKNNLILSTTKEKEYIEIIKKSFQNFKSKTQYVVGNYRIDLFFSRFKFSNRM